MTTNVILKRFDLIADTPGNIPLLRRFVIDLAVRGKLVENESANESAENLLRRIAAKKQQLVKDGKIKKQRLLPPIGASDVPAAYLTQCVFERLANIAILEKGLTGIQSATPGDYPMVVTAEARSSCDHYDFDGSAAIIPMVSSSGHGNASLKRLHYQEGKFALGNILCAAFPISGELISARFLYEYLTAFKEELLVSKMIGTANVSLTIGKIGEVPVPIVSPAVQRRVYELMALCDRLEAAQAERERQRDRLVAASLHRLENGSDIRAVRKHVRFHLDHLPRLTNSLEHISQLRKVILDLAVRGQLIAQDPNDEPATELINCVQAEIERLITAGKRKKVTPLPPIDAAQAPFHLPSGWVWARFPELGTFGRGKSKHRPRNDPSLFEGGSHLVVQTGDVARSNGVIETHTSKYNDLGLAQSAKWPKGTLCITIAANIADSGILSFDACFPDSVVGFIPASVFASAVYFEYFVRTAKADLLKFAPATAQKNINLEILNAVLIPLPPLAEQRRIVAKVDELMTLCDRLEAQLTTTRTESRRLLESILNEAIGLPLLHSTPGEAQIVPLSSAAANARQRGGLS